LNASGHEASKTRGAYRCLTNFAGEKKGFRRRGSDTVFANPFLAGGSVRRQLLLY
jgi:hypothetical protein